jgi:NitT/TauT family transport system ATP-binding protein
VLFPNPGRMGLVLGNPMPYPRNAQSSEFRNLVATIHESIIRQCMPDRPIVGLERVPEHLQHPTGEPGVQAIPPVPPGQIVGLLSIMKDTAPGSSVYTLSNAIGREFGEVISLVSAAEILGFVDTPGNQVRLTALGRRFLAAHRKDKRLLFAGQIRTLGLFRELGALIEREGPLTESAALGYLSSALPYDNSERLLHTIVAWGRYAGFLDFDTANKCLRLVETSEKTGHINSQ